MIVLFITVGFVLTLIGALELRNWFSNDIQVGMAIMLAIGIFLMVFGIGSTVALLQEDHRVDQQYTQKISALADGSSIEGRFYLMSGTIDEEDYFFYIADHGDYKQKSKIKSEGAKIYEDSTDCRIEVDQYYYKWFIFKSSTLVEEVRIYIPENSITSDYSIDLN